MAISPSDARKLTTAEQDLVNELEVEIDARLQEGNLSFNNFPQNVSEKVLNELKARYHSAGWNVKVLRGKNDSVFFDFSVKDPD